MISVPPENYRFLIENEWRDIHHSRIQEWSALGVISAAHIGLLQLWSIIKSNYGEADFFCILMPSLCFLALFFVIIGILMACRHRKLMWIKLNWIFEAEDKLGLIKNDTNENGIIPDEYWRDKYLLKYLMFFDDASICRKLENCFKQRKWNRLMWPRVLSTSWLMVMIYLLFGLIDIGIFMFSLESLMRYKA